jgi:hypothetical protein
MRVVRYPPAALVAESEWTAPESTRTEQAMAVLSTTIGSSLDMAGWEYDVC